MSHLTIVEPIGTEPLKTPKITKYAPSIRQLPPDDDGNILFQCKICNGAKMKFPSLYSHQCLVFLHHKPVYPSVPETLRDTWTISHQKTSSVGEDQQIVFDHKLYLISFTLSFSISLTTVSSQDFIGFLNENAATPIPKTSYPALRQAVLNFRTTLRTKLLNLLKGMVVAIMVDGARKGKRIWEGYIMYTPIGIFPLEVLALDDSTTDTLITHMADFYKMLSEHGITVVGFTSDNASNMIGAFDAREGKMPIQFKRSIPCYRVPCCCHTMNLGNEDFFQELVSQILPGDQRTFLQVLNSILKVLDASYLFATDTQWESCNRGVKYIAERVELISTGVDFAHDLHHVFHSIKWAELFNVTSAVSKSMEKLQRDRTALSDVYPILMDLKLTLCSQAESNPYAESAWLHIWNRFFTVQDFGLTIASYLMTYEGRLWYKSKFVGIAPGTNIELETMALTIRAMAIRSLVSFAGIRQRISATPQAFQMIDMMFSHYLQSDEPIFNQAKSAFLFWGSIYSRYLAESNEIGMTFALIGRDLSALPASEASVEREFYHLSKLCSGPGMNKKDDLIQALLYIKCYFFWKCDEYFQTPTSPKPQNTEQSVKKQRKPQIKMLGRSCQHWTVGQDNILLALVEIHGTKWTKILSIDPVAFAGKSVAALQNHYKNLMKKRTTTPAPEPVPFRKHVIPFPEMPVLISAPNPSTAQTEPMKEDVETPKRGRKRNDEYTDKYIRTMSAKGDIQFNQEEIAIMVAFNVLPKPPIHVISINDLARHLRPFLPARPLKDIRMVVVKMLDNETSQSVNQAIKA